MKRGNVISNRTFTVTNTVKSNHIRFQMKHLTGVHVSILVSKLTQKITAFLQEISVLATLNILLTLRSILFCRLCVFVGEILSFSAEVYDRYVVVYKRVRTVNELGIQFLRNF
jgi:hypothetical protein